MVDDEGRLRIVVGRLRRSEGAEGAYGVAVLDTGGHVRMWLALEATGPTLVFDESGNDVVHLGVDDPSPDAVRTGAFLYLADGIGRPVLSWLVDLDGTLSVRPESNDP